MNAKSDNHYVIEEFNSLIKLVPFGVLHNDEFIPLKGMSIEDNGKLFYQNDNNEKTSVSLYIKDKTGLQTARWLNHLYFKDGYGKEQKFKKYVAEKHNLKFT